MRQWITIVGAVSTILVMVFVAGCNRPANPTGKKGQGGLPTMEVPNEGGDQTPWSPPAELIYSNATQLNEGNTRVWIVADSVESVAAWYMGAMAGATQEEVEGGRHVKVKTKELEVDIEAYGEHTQITYYPTDMGFKVES